MPYFLVEASYHESGTAQAVIKAANLAEARAQAEEMQRDEFDCEMPSDCAFGDSIEVTRCSKDAYTPAPNANSEPFPFVSARELATVLAALRYWQSSPELGNTDSDIGYIATDGGEHEPMGRDEIDDLCERLNIPLQAVGPRVVVRVHGGAFEVAYSNMPIELAVLDSDDFASNAPAMKLKGPRGERLRKATVTLTEAEVAPEWVADAWPALVAIEEVQS